MFYVKHLEQTRLVREGGSAAISGFSLQNYEDMFLGSIVKKRFSVTDCKLTFLPLIFLCILVSIPIHQYTDKTEVMIQRMPCSMPSLLQKLIARY